MKDKSLIFYGNPCLISLADPAVQTLEQAAREAVRLCPFYPDRRQCSPPRYGCVQVAGVKMARYVLQFYSEANEQTLAMEKEEFCRLAPLPPDQVEAYIDTAQYGYRRITDPDLVVERVWQFACAVLDLRPGERIFRGSDELWPSPAPLDEEQAEELLARVRSSVGA